MDIRRFRTRDKRIYKVIILTPQKLFQNFYIRFIL